MRVEQNLKSVARVRSATEADVPFLFHTWLKSFRGANRSISGPVYYQFQHKLIENIFKRANVLVACSTEDENQLFGYLVCETMDNVPVLHYSYVKEDYRGMGMLKLLLEHSELDISKGGFFTHCPKNLGKLLAKHPALIYNPYLAFGGME